jgi:hypothetical protein
MSKESDTLSNVMPSASPTPEELAEWHALPPEEQRARFAKALELGFQSPAAGHDIDVIIAEAKAELKTASHG